MAGNMMKEEMWDKIKEPLGDNEVDMGVGADSMEQCVSVILSRLAPEDCPWSS